MFKITNAYAMQYGVLLGLWGIVSLAVMGWSLSVTSLSALSMFMLTGSPFIATLFTFKFRKKMAPGQEEFTFGRGYVFTLLMGLYASLWIALFLYVYFAFLDGGYIFNAYEHLLSSPEYRQQVEQTGLLQQADGSVSSYFDALRRLPPAYYAGSILYLTLFSAPVISAIIAFVARRKKRV